MRKTLVLITIALAVPATSAARVTALNACKLVSTRQSASLGVTAACKSQTLPGSLGVISSASWGSPAELVLSVNTFDNTNNPVWQLTMKTLKIMAGGPPRRVSGIGSVAWEAGGPGGHIATIHFVKGKRVVAFSWSSKKPQRSLKSFTAIAKSIASQL